MNSGLSFFFDDEDPAHDVYASASGILAVGS